MDLSLTQMKWLLVILAIAVLFLVRREYARGGFEGFSGSDDYMTKLINELDRSPKNLYDFVYALNNGQPITLPSDVQINGKLTTNGNSTINGTLTTVGDTILGGKLDTAGRILAQNAAHIGAFGNGNYASFSHKSRVGSKNWALLVGKVESNGKSNTYLNGFGNRPQLFINDDRKGSIPYNPN